VSLLCYRRTANASGGSISHLEGEGTKHTNAHASTIRIGNLILDLYDRAAKQPAWAGAAATTMNPTECREKNQTYLETAMQKLLKNDLPNGKK
jgi:hypothetical protein